MNHNQFMPPIRPTGPADRTDVRKPVSRPTPAGQSFENVLSEAVQKQKIDVTFSAHAMNRMRMNRVELTGDQLQKIGDAVDKAQEKGAREALLILGDIALVTSIKNRTVITVVNGDRMRENIFTNIDSAMIL